MCSYIDLRLIKVATGDAAVSQSINEAIVDEVAVGEKDYENIKAYMNSINDVAEDEYLSLEQYCGWSWRSQAGQGWRRRRVQTHDRLI